jgi:hypothetical protein
MAKKGTDEKSNDEMLEELVRTQREKIEKILKEQKKGETLRDKAEPKKKEAEEILKSVLTLFINPDVQGHFVKAGIEFLSGVEQLIRNAPLPEDMKKNVNTACEMKDMFVKEVVTAMDESKPKDKDKKKNMKKIDVE